MVDTIDLRSISVTSGKGGVGKSNIVANLGIAFANLGRRVLIIDADVGLANMDIVLGIKPQFTIQELLSGEAKIDAVITQAYENLWVLPAASGVAELSEFSEEDKIRFLEEIETIESQYDLILLDTSAGISPTVRYFNAAAQEVFIIATTEPTSMTDAYAIIKVLYMKDGVKNFRLIVNQVKNSQEARMVYEKLSHVTENFLSIKLDFVGYIFSDPHVIKAVRQRKPFLLAFPDSVASKCITSIAQSILKHPPQGTEGRANIFWRNLVQNINLKENRATP